MRNCSLGWIGSRLRRGGVTLAEAIVVIFLFVTALGLVSALFSNTVRYAHISEARNDIQESRANALASLREAVARSCQRGNSAFYADGPSGVDLVLSLITTKDSEGNLGWSESLQEPLYRGYQIFYRKAADKTLRTLRVDIPETSQPQQLSKEEIEDKLNANGDRIIAASVTRFQLYSPVNGSLLDSWSNFAALRLTQETERATPIVTEFTFRLQSI